MPLTIESLTRFLVISCLIGLIKIDALQSQLGGCGAILFRDIRFKPPTVSARSTKSSDSEECFRLKGLSIVVFDQVAMRSSRVSFYGL